MNTNDLPPAARLASLIETGKAAHPDIAHGQGRLIHGGRACALGFACLAAGWTREKLEADANAGATGYDFLVAVTGLPYFHGVRDVWVANDRGASLEEICRALREGELATVTVPA
jgi:hypothetical protein